MRFNLQRMKQNLDTREDNGAERLEEVYRSLLTIMQEQDVTTDRIKNAADRQIYLAEDFLETGQPVHFTAEQTGSVPFDLDSEDVAKEVLEEADIVYAAAEFIEYLKGAPVTKAAQVYIDRADLNIEAERRYFNS